MQVTIMAKDGTKIVNLNRKKAIREKCLNCSCWSTKEADNCSYQKCAIHSFRSGKGGQNAKERSRAIKDYCLWCMSGQSAEVGKCVSTDCSLFNFKRG